MSLSVDSENTWKNTEELSAPMIEEPIERIENENQEDFIENTLDSVSDISGENVETTTELTYSEEIIDVEPTDNYVETENKSSEKLNTIQKIKNIPNYLHKKLNLKCALCSSV
jgi:hypothetical protein